MQDKQLTTILTTLIKLMKTSQDSSLLLKDIHTQQEHIASLNKQQDERVTYVIKQFEDILNDQTVDLTLEDIKHNNDKILEKLQKESLDYSPVIEKLTESIIALNVVVETSLKQQDEKIDKLFDLLKNGSNDHNHQKNTENAEVESLLQELESFQ